WDADNQFRETVAIHIHRRQGRAKLITGFGVTIDTIAGPAPHLACRGVETGFISQQDMHDALAVVLTGNADGEIPVSVPVEIRRCQRSAEAIEVFTNPWDAQTVLRPDLIRGRQSVRGSIGDDHLPGVDTIDVVVGEPHRQIEASVPIKIAESHTRGTHL